MPLLLVPALYNGIWVQSVHFDIDYYLITAIISAESSFNPLAIGDNGDSYGLMQLYLGGAGYGHLPSQLLEIDYNLEVGVAYLRQCIDAYPDELPRAVAAYNRGIDGASWLDSPEADAYVDKVLDWAEYFRQIGIKRDTRLADVQ